MNGNYCALMSEINWVFSIFTLIYRHYLDEYFPFFTHMFINHYLDCTLAQDITEKQGNPSVTVTNFKF